MPHETAHGSPQARNGHDRVSFSELARVHYEWDRTADPLENERFRETLEAFESEAGDIVDAYWCRKDASAVALTHRRRRPRGVVRRLVDDGDEFRLYRLSDWVTVGIRELPDLLHDCDILAIKAANGLEGVPRAVVMQWLMAVEAHVLGFVERHRDSEPDRRELADFVRRQRAELTRIEAYYQHAGQNRARLHYAEGMFGIGILLVVLAALATLGLLKLFGAGNLHDSDVREFYAAAAAGALGAIISVMMRMSGRGEFSIDHELGRKGVTLVGAYRPLVGSVSGIVVYFLVQTPLLPLKESILNVAFFVVVAFLAGFSERWTRIMLSGAMRTISDSADDEAPEAGKATGTVAPS